MTMYMLVGGIGTLAGPLLGALAIPWLTQYLQFLQAYRFVVFGPILILLVIFLPNGIVGLYRARKSKHAKLATAKNGVVSRQSQPTRGDRHA